MDVNGFRVLIVDDIPGAVAVLREMLLDIGITQIEEAHDGREALRKLDDTPVNLVISDYAMRGMSGLELLSAVRNDPTHAGVPFLMVSGKSDFSVIENALQEGAAAYIFKPVDMNLLKNTVMSLMQRAAQ